MHFDGRFTSNTIVVQPPALGWGADFFLGLPDSFGRGVSTGKTWSSPAMSLVSTPGYVAPH